MADHEQRAPVRAHEPEQPVLGVAVEVVGGLVEQQHVAAGEEDAGDLHAPPLAARQRADRLVEPIGLEAEPGGDAAHLALGRVPTVEAEPLLGAGEAAHGALGRVLLHLEAQLLDADHRLVEPAPGEDVAHRGGGVVDAVEPRVLREVPEAAAAVHDAGVRVRGAAEHLQQARLAGAVAADQPDLVAGADREAGAVEDDVAADLDRELPDLQHPSMLTGRRRPGRIGWPSMPSDVMQALYEGRRADAEALAAERDIDVFEAASLGDHPRLAALLRGDEASPRPGPTTASSPSTTPASSAPPTAPPRSSTPARPSTSPAATTWACARSTAPPRACTPSTTSGSSSPAAPTSTRSRPAATPPSTRHASARTSRSSTSSSRRRRDDATCVTTS